MELRTGNVTGNVNGKIMITENIQKLLSSSSMEDRAVGFQLAKFQGLEDDPDFQRYVFSNVAGVVKYIERTFNSKEARELTNLPYKYFKIRDIPSWDLID